MRSLVVALILSTSVLARADDWPRPHPRGFHGRGFGRVAEVFPAKSRNNPSDRPVVHVYDVGYPGTAWAVDAKLAWKGPLANRESPYEAILFGPGWLATFDDWGNLGHDNAVVLYDPTGKLVKAFKLDELLPADVRDLDRSVSSRYWRKGAQYVFSTTENVLQVRFTGGDVLVVSLDGSARYFAAKVAPKVPAGAEPIEVWETSLRFASITDVLAAQAGASSTKPRGAAMTNREAIASARRALVGKVEVPPSSPVRVRRRAGTVIVTFEAQLAPGVRGPDFHARVTLDVGTGVVLEVLGGP